VGRRKTPLPWTRKGSSKQTIVKAHGVGKTELVRRGEVEMGEPVIGDVDTGVGGKRGRRKPLSNENRRYVVLMEH